MADEATTPGRSTLLEAVNVLLDCIGEQPVNSLEGPQIGEAQRARSVLLEVHRAGQARGWAFNSERDYPFPRAANGEIPVPDSLASFNPAQLEWNARFQLRGSRIYDTWKHTYSIDASITEIRGDVIWYLSWEQCPEVFNRYCTCSSARTFVARALGDEGQTRLNGLDEMQAMTELERWQMAAVKPNSLFAGGGGYPFRTFYPARGLGGRGREDLVL